MEISQILPLLVFVPHCYILKCYFVIVQDMNKILVFIQPNSKLYNFITLHFSGKIFYEFFLECIFFLCMWKTEVNEIFYCTILILLLILYILRLIIAFTPELMITCIHYWSQFRLIFNYVLFDMYSFTLVLGKRL